MTWRVGISFCFEIDMLGRAGLVSGYIRLREAVDKYQAVLMGDLIGFT